MDLKFDENAFPVLGEGYNRSDYGRIDLSNRNKEIVYSSEFSQDILQSCIHNQKTRLKIKIPYGGYGEQRFFYELSPLFSSSGKIRSVHLGTDLWAAEGTPVFAPFDAYVHGYAFNNKPLDYGATIILSHTIAGITFYSLYGHLSLQSIQFLKTGIKIRKGQDFCKIGNMQENGGWVPHLHLQLIRDIGEHYGDYPGVATREDAKYMLRNSPDPEKLIFGD